MFHLDYFLPTGAVRLLEYRRRFRSLHLPPQFCFSKKYRGALLASLLELLPREELAAPRCVVDVGANLGYWCRAIASLTPAEVIIAYEPVPELFDRLCANTRKYPQIRCVQSAVGSVSGKIEMSFEETHEMSSVLKMREDMRLEYASKQAKSKSIIVPMTTLDESLKDHKEISLLKVDVQGYESEVLKGAQSVLKRTRVLITEILYASHYHGDLEFADLYLLIRSLSNLRLWGISKPSCSRSGKPLWADAVFIQSAVS